VEAKSKYQLPFDGLSPFVTCMQSFSIDVVIIVVAAVSVGAVLYTGAVPGQYHAICPTIWHL
jgi:hypothetical protein